MEEIEIFVNGERVTKLNGTQLNVLKYNIAKSDLESDLKRRVNWVIMHKYENCFERLKKEWEPKLIANGVKSFPADKDEFAELVFKQPNYKDDEARSAEGHKEKIVDNGADL
jgi:hypothetical protein